MKAHEIALKAADLIDGEKRRQYGDKFDSFNKVATLWNAWLRVRRRYGEELDAEDVAQMMSLFKKVRSQTGEPAIDTPVDDVGYSALAGEIGLSKAES
jgi:hypothetical protein